MLKNGGGGVVNTASVAGLQGLPTAPAYVGAKHGVAGLTKTVAPEFAQRAIRINAVYPGFVHTPLVDRCLDRGAFSEEQILAAEPMHRMGKPEEIAEAVLWLCSDASSFVTGLPMPVDGGYVAQ
jgi:NAD(P)-dependent dehydrogenase (short-subunit alcohol dehydrogenase family)